MGKMISYTSAFAACAIMALTSGCVSGGFKLTKEWAHIVNNQQIIVRIILYIISLPVFAITLLIDSVIFNTQDFWEGKVSAGEYQFNGEGNNYQVRHEYVNGRRRSTIHITDEKSNPVQDLVFNETSSGEIEVMVDGKLRARVRDIKQVPLMAIYDGNGRLVKDGVLLTKPSDTTDVAEAAL